MRKLFFFKGEWGQHFILVLRNNLSTRILYDSSSAGYEYSPWDACEKDAHSGKSSYRKKGVEWKWAQLTHFMICYRFVFIGKIFWLYFQLSPSLNTLKTNLRYSKTINHNLYQQLLYMLKIIYNLASFPWHFWYTVRYRICCLSIAKVLRSLVNATHSFVALPSVKNHRFPHMQFQFLSSQIAGNIFFSWMFKKKEGGGF